MRVFSFVGAEEGKKERKVLIKRVVGEESVVQRAKELIKAKAEEGGMRAFVESRAEGAKPAETEEAPPSQDGKEEDKDKAGWSPSSCSSRPNPRTRS